MCIRDSSYVDAAKTASGLPVLRKDFTVSPLDVVDARLMGADCVLLIAAALDDDELGNFFQLTKSLSMDALFEVHSEAELKRVLELSPTLVGVNQRDLVTFEVDPNRAAALGALLPDGIIKVAESGISSASQLTELAAAGFTAGLIGESLVTAKNPAELLSDLAATKLPV